MRDYYVIHDINRSQIGFIEVNTTAGNINVGMVLFAIGVAFFVCFFLCGGIYFMYSCTTLGDKVKKWKKDRAEKKRIEAATL